MNDLIRQPRLCRLCWWRWSAAFIVGLLMAMGLGRDGFRPAVGQAVYAQAPADLPADNGTTAGAEDVDNDGIEPATEDAETPPPQAVPAPGNLYFESAWNPRIGLRLEVTPDNDVAGWAAPVALHVAVGDLQLTTVRRGAPDRVADIADRIRWRPDALPDQARDRVEWLLKVRDAEWLLYCDDQWVAWLPAPFDPPMSLVAFSGVPPRPETLDNAFFQRVESWQFSDDFMIPETDEDAGLGDWMPVSGDWHVHTVRDEAGAPQRGQRTLLPEFSPNFYSMKGMGTNALIVSGYEFYDRYRFDAAVEAQPGEMGLVVYYSEISGDYYGFTVTLPTNAAMDALAALWHTRDGDAGQRRYLAAARVPDLFPDQWLRLEVETRHDRIMARLDGHTLFDVEHALPGGGMFGFFADADIEIIFDDVTAATVPDLDLRDADHIRFHQVAAQGDFFPDQRPTGLLAGWRRWFRRERDAGGDAGLAPMPVDTDRWLAVGSPQHAGQVLSAVFQPRNDDFHAGWIAGLNAAAGRPPSASDPHLRFTAQRFDGDMIFRLFHVEAPGRMELLEQFRGPVAGAPDDPVTLMLDMTEGHRLRLYSNGQLVLIHEADDAPVGAAGPFVAAGSDVVIRDWRYEFERRDIWTTSQEKNPVFLTDPFMRHWSSPEGEWITDDAEMTWHKSDFFGRFNLTLPVVSNATVHLGIRDGDTNGPLAVTINNGIVSLYATDKHEVGATRLLSAEMYPRGRDASTNQALFSVEVEDHWVFVTADDTTVLRHTMRAPLAGTRLRIAGFTIDDLTHSEVIRHQVQDHLFTEAPSGWRFNGGAWRVVNRFQCDPRWSHMNAESRDGLAAAWTKRRFSGDFSVEMYAGMRHGWYERCGDMNLTVLSRDGTPSQGYTVTGTGWDPDLSQLDSMFYRDGVAVDRSDAYMAPRRREGNRRMRHEAVVRGGRDVHGAWYYIKLRRIGNRLEYYFDNELIFTQEDDDPLDAGRVGIWTFMNSIMIARVSISAQGREPAHLPFDSISPADVVRPVFRQTAMVDDPAPIAPPTSPALDRLTPPAMTASAWTAVDPVGHARLTWHQDAFYGPYFVVTTRLGGGGMVAGAQMAPQRYRDLAGWRFDLTRTDRANLNAHFSIGRRDGNGDYQAVQHYFHRISATDFDRGNWRRHGGTSVPGAAAAGSPYWHMAGRWTPVTIWLPTDGLPASHDDPNLWVRFEGFGIRQPSVEMQGLLGNGPGEAYAVARFSAIANAGPQPDDESASVSTNTVAPLGYRLYDGPARNMVLAQGDADEIMDALRDRNADGINRYWVETDEFTPGYPRDMIWLTAPAAPEVSVEWDGEQPDTLVVRSATDWPWRELARAEFRVGEHGVTARSDAAQRYRLVLPPSVTADTNRPGAPIDLQIAVPGQDPRPFEVATDDPHRLPMGPVLTRLAGMTPLYENFESLDFGETLQADPNRMTLARDTSGAYVEIANRALNQRLQTVLNGPVCLARYPLLQFRYRGDRMSMLSLRLQNDWVVRLNEPHPSAAEVRYASPFVNDGHWHQWAGMISEVVHREAFSHSMYTVNNLRLGSFHRIDQSGAFSRWALAEWVLGPAVNDADQLTFTADFQGLLPVESVMMALHPGLTSVYDWDAEALDRIAWHTIENRTPVTPSIDTLEDGVAQLLLRAVDSGGTPSALIAIPFLLDRTAPRVTHTMEAHPHPLGNDVRLRLDYDTAEGAPVLLETVRLGFNDQTPIAIDPFLSSTALRPPGLRVHLNWPYLLRAAIQRHSPGEPAVLRISGLRDGAGNVAADIEVPIDVPDEQDDVGPAWLPAEYGEPVLFNTAWEGRLNPSAYFNPARNNPVSIEHRLGDEPYLKTLTHGNSGNIALAFSGQSRWTPADHPYLAFRLRQPAPNAENPPEIDLVISLDNEQTVRVNLGRPTESDDATVHAQPIAWASNQWHAVIVDVPDLLRRSGVEEIAARRVQSIAFDRRRAANQMPLDVQSVFVFRAWQPGETLRLDAYDRSGVAGLTWSFEDSEGTVLSRSDDPRDVPPKTPGWLVIRTLDRAGNLSVPLRIPMVLAVGDAPAPFAERVRDVLHLVPEI